MADKKKNALAIVFGAPKDKGEPDGDEGAPPPPEGEDDFRAACDEAFDAVTNGDKAAFCEALKAAFDLHKSGDAYPDEGEE